MNSNPIKQIFQFNQEAGFLDGEYSDTRESAYSIEEMLEGFNSLPNLCMHLGIKDEGSSPKDISRYIIELANYNTDIPDVDRLDKHLDSIIYNFGSIFKLGLSPQDAMHALQIVMEHNMAKLKDKQIDEAGKLLKPKDFVGPENDLQNLLDKR